MFRIIALTTSLLILLATPALAQSKFTDAQKIIRGSRTNEPAAKNTAQKSSAASAKAAPTKEPPILLSKDELAAGWISLFDGQTLFGWKAHSEADWKVENGTIVVTSGKPGLLCTSVQFDNYVLKADFRAAKGTNSGLFLRTAQVPAKEDITTRCYELNIAPPDNPFPTGSLVGRKKYGEAGETDGWRTFEATVDGSKVVIKLDGQEVLSYDDPKPASRGYIGLQLNSGKCEFKNIKLRPLGLKSIFNGKDLAGWKEPAGSLSKFTVTKQGELNVKNGRGTLESDAQFGDFALQFDCISHAKNLNSGIFFRSIPGEINNANSGYESQVHNGYKDGDRAKPLDFGTGGIYRRIAARLVVPNDEEWFHKTVIADGPHIAVWVNGYQVTDWTDTRKPDKNPRNGLRLEKGTLQIQGHDPTTNLSFRNLKVAEMAK